MEISMWMFLVIAVVMAIVIGRAGTLLKDYFATKLKYKRVSRFNQLISSMC